MPLPSGVSYYIWQLISMLSGKLSSMAHKNLIPSIPQDKGGNQLTRYKKRCR